MRRAGLVLVSGWMVLAGCSRRISDDEIASRLKAMLYSDSELRPLGLLVAVRDGEVTLNGGVPNAELQLRAFQVAYSTAGVNAVRDEMRILLPAPRPAIAAISPPALPRIPAPKAFVAKPFPEPPFPEADDSKLALTNPLPDPPEARLTTTPEAQSKSRRRAEPPPGTAADITPVTTSMTTAITTALPTRHTRRTYSRVTLVISAPSNQDFPARILLTDFQEQQRNVTLDYEAEATETGLKRLAEGAVDLTITGSSLTKNQVERFGRKPRQIPFAVYGMGPVYHLPGITETVNFTPAALAGIFLGKVTRWNDPLLTAANPKLSLPNRGIVVAHQSNNPGSLWAQYLAKGSEESGLRHGENLFGTGVQGERGMMDFLKQVPYSLGYAELSTRISNPVSRGAVQNAKGRFVKGSEQSLAAAALSPSELLADGRISILNASAQDAYPISAFEWFVLRDDQTPQRDALDSLVEWVLTKRSGKFALPGYAPLPEPFAAAIWENLRTR